MKTKHHALLLAALWTASCASTQMQTTQTSAYSQSAAQTRTRENSHHGSLAQNAFGESRQKMQTDRTLLLDLQALPAQTASVSIPLDNLLGLPEGAKYSSRNGRTSVEAIRRGDTLVLSGFSDSVRRERLLLATQTKERELSRDSSKSRFHEAAASCLQTDSTSYLLRSDSSSSQTKKKARASWHWWLITGFLAGGSCGALLTRTNPLKALIRILF